MAIEAIGANYVGMQQAQNRNLKSAQSFTSKPEFDEEKSNASKLMLGATALAAVVGLGIAGYKGKLGKGVQKFFGETKKAATNTAGKSVNEPKLEVKSNKYTSLDWDAKPISRKQALFEEKYPERKRLFYIHPEADKEFEVLRKKGYKINIYRINKQDEHYKKNMSGLIYTDVEYVAISESKMNVKELVGLYGIEVVKDESNFVTMGRTFYVVEFVVRKENYEIKRYFQKHGYKIETSESLEILWPPMYSTDTTLVTTADTIDVSSSFRLIPHGNINIVGDKIEEDGGVYKISIDTRTIINEKNIDVLIVKNNVLCHDYSGKEPELIYLNKFNVPNDYDYFLFSKDGCVRLISGSNVYLTQGDKIIGYKNGLIKVYINGVPDNVSSLEKRINDIVKYHPQSEPFVPDEFMNIEVNDIILNYLETCYRSGVINSTVKRYIEEKKI